ncbi:uncharacterized protein EV422DRAFT_568448 [Fimicolochytrium jonesii]|uniref:uncharacterized protein n=1 Tax=Fimicolochytrium jonesii TaxID=1396493 RepID=UPI0022FDB676|nr:uncharacterized protein EV422DRAFT_568448 [Fimicolochytrium jonesii]KAI8820004.1 hypothetical protein EV422DRAFT_568448 [Fimicolochytrium jonesii]
MAVIQEDSIVIAGGSSGGHLATIMAFTQNNPTFQPGFEAVSTRFSACMAFYPPIDLTNTSGHAPDGYAAWFASTICKPEFNQAEWVRKNACPMGMVTGNGTDSRR